MLCFTLPDQMVLSMPNTDDGDSDGVRGMMFVMLESGADCVSFHSVSFAHIIF